MTYQLVTRNVESIAYRSAVAVALLAGLVLVWMNFVQAADGVNPAATMFLAVPIVGIVGAGLTRLRATGMARALFATALVQALVPAIALVRNPPVSSWAAAVWREFGLSAALVVLFVGSAFLFRKAEGEESAPGAG